MRKRVIGEFGDAARASRSLEELARTALPLMMRASGAHSGALFELAPGAPKFHAVSHAIVDVNHWATRYAPTDPYCLAAIRRNLEIDLSSEQVSPDQGARTEVMQEFFMPIGFHDWVTARLTETPTSAFGQIGLFLFRSELGAWKRREAEAIRPAMRILRAATQRIDQARRDQLLLANALDELLDEPTLIFDHEGELRWLSRPALHHFAPSPFSRVPDLLRRTAAAVAAAEPGHPSDKTVETPEGMVRLRRVVPSDGETLVIAQLAQASPSFRARYAITHAEWQVFTLLGAGLSQRQVSERLATSYETVRTHVKRLLGKLGVHSVAQALLLALKADALPR